MQAAWMRSAVFLLVCLLAPASLVHGEFHVAVLPGDFSPSPAFDATVAALCRATASLDITCTRLSDAGPRNAHDLAVSGAYDAVVAEVKRLPHDLSLILLLYVLMEGSLYSSCALHPMCVHCIVALHVTCIAMDVPKTSNKKTPCRIIREDARCTRHSIEHYANTPGCHRFIQTLHKQFHPEYTSL